MTEARNSAISSRSRAASSKRNSAAATFISATTTSTPAASPPWLLYEHLCAALAASSLAFFLASFQVHEKAILLPLLPLSLLARRLPLLGRLNVVRSWAALRVMTQDGFPIYDQSENNVWADPTTTDMGAQNLPLTLILAPWSMNVVIVK